VPDQPKSIPQVMSELKELTVSYAKQETVEPFKAMGRFVLWGVGGAFLLAVGLSLLGLSGLRALQTETGDALDDSMSWVPYIIVSVALAGLAGMSILAIRRSNIR
jgi:Putative Actinobacterial Holin-X, holin superfamily III